jgi:5'-nucleotidase
LGEKEQCQDGMKESMNTWRHLSAQCISLGPVFQASAFALMNILVQPSHPGLAAPGTRLGPRPAEAYPGQTMGPFLLLLTNDDGIRSPGLLAAVRACLGLGELLVAAPSSQQTAMGRSLTGRPEARFHPFPLEVDGRAVPAFECEASPASVVRHALQALCGGRRPDLLVSGINYGENVGTSIWASGTVGAAIEGASMGIPALAAALQTPTDTFHVHSDQDWGAAEHFLRGFARALLGATLPPDVDLLKVDVPAGATPDSPWRLTRLSRQRYFEQVLPHPTPSSALGEGRLGHCVDLATLEPDSDIRAILDGHVALTPLSLDATSRTPFPAILDAFTVC